MLLQLAVLCALCSDAVALTPPVGWTAVGLDRAVLDKANVDRGEILEIRLPAGTGDPRELVTALKDLSVTVERFGTDPNGATNLVLSTRMGRARYQRGGEGITWWVVFVGKSHASNLDPDALLKAVAPTPDQVAWGEKEAVRGGSDGTPWGTVASAPESGDGWVSEVAVTAWAQDASVVGTWEGNTRLRGVSTRMWFRFENTGFLQILRQGPEGKEIDEGKWATRGGLIQLDIEGGGANVPYMTTGRTLSITYAGASISLYRQ